MLDYQHFMLQKFFLFASLLSFHFLLDIVQGQSVSSGLCESSKACDRICRLRVWPKILFTDMPKYILTVCTYHTVLHIL